MTTDDVPETGERPATKSSDDFSSESYIAKIAKENYIARFSPENYVETHDVEAPDSADRVTLGSAAKFDSGSDDAADPTDVESTATDDVDGFTDTADADHVTDTDDTAETDDAAETDDTDDTDDTADINDTDDPAETDANADETGIHAAIEKQAAAGEDGDETPVDAGSDGYLEMRQVAGLTAGSMMKLTVGRAFEFNESNEGGSFSLRVLENGEVVVHPGTARAVIDEVDVDEPMLVGDALLNVSSACFSVRPPRPPASSESRMEAIGAAFASISAISVPALGTEQPLAPDQLTGSRLGTIINRNPLTRGAIGHRAWDFLQSIRQARSVVAERHRLLHPDPEELKTRLSRLDPGLWERSHEHPLFGRFAIGYANIPWEPKFDNPELIPDILHEPIVEMSLLPWVPVTANLLYGPLGIVGKRAARLAACRHAILSLAALSMPGEVQFAIRSGKNTAMSWNWARALPAIMSTGDDSPYMVTIIDGADGALADEAAREAADEAAGDSTDDADPTGATDQADVGADDPYPTGEVPLVNLDAGGDSESPTAGCIVLADSVDELSRPCGTVLQVEPDGTGSVTNHLNETIHVTPIGVTEAFAHDMATRITDILTKSFL